MDDRSAKEDKELKRNEKREGGTLRKTDDDEEKEREETRRTEERIRTLEFSIQSLDLQLERISMEKINKKTSTVQKTMSLATPGHSIFHHSSG